MPNARIMFHFMFSDDRSFASNTVYLGFIFIIVGLIAKTIPNVAKRPPTNPVEIIISQCFKIKATVPMIIPKNPTI